MADSLPIVNRPRKSPPSETLLLPSETPPPVFGAQHPRLVRPPETFLPVLGTKSRARQPSETHNPPPILGDRVARPSETLLPVRVQDRTVRLSETPLAVRGQNRAVRPSETPRPVLGGENRVRRLSETHNPPPPVVGAHIQVGTPLENPNLTSLGAQNQNQVGETSNRLRILELLRGFRQRRERIRGIVFNSERWEATGTIAELLKCFRNRCDEIRLSNPREHRSDLKALSEFKKLKSGNPKSIGPIPGVEIGQTFRCRSELIITGIHGRLQHGIEFMESMNGMSVATCVVAKQGYHDKMNHPEFLVYGGEGGEMSRNGCQSGKKKRLFKADQVLKRGNLALKNSIKARNDVRVVRGVRDPVDKGRILYVYDGIYLVLECRTMEGSEGNIVFQFEMARKPGQKAIDWKNVRLIE